MCLIYTMYFRKCNKKCKYSTIKITVKSTFYKESFLIDKAPWLMYNNYNN